VPSLINRWYVLDLATGRSLIEWLGAQGHEVYCIDWGTPRPEDRFLELDDVCDVAIGRALRRSARTSADGRVHLLGYCLGGTLAAIHAAARPERVATLLALAAPIDFRQGGLLARWSTAPSFDVGALVDALGNVPWPLMQASFHLLRPTLALGKSVALVDRAWDDEFLDGFLATERWGNDNVSFPGAAYRRYIEDLYRDNRLIAGTMALAGRTARLEAITCPTLAVSFTGDHIVPAASSAALIDRVGASDRQRLELAGGHVGAVVSRRAAERLWPTLHRFWAERDGRTPPPGFARATGPLSRRYPGARTSPSAAS
jgi:polyhydroxyalkanoate synthase